MKEGHYASKGFPNQQVRNPATFANLLTFSQPIFSETS
jgi:hypothetical protein